MNIIEEINGNRGRSRGSRTAQSTAPHLEVPGSPVNQPPARRLLFRMLIPLLVLGALFALLGLIYRGAMPEGTKKVVVKPVPKPVKPAPSYETLKGQYMQMLTGGVKTLEGFNPGKYRGSAAAVEKELNVFQAWAIFLDEADRYPLSVEERATVAKVANGFSALQRREFPAMRAEWARGLRASLSRFKVIASCSGDRSQFLHVICPPQAGQEGMNRTAMELQGETAARLRFARIQFTFTDGFTVTAPVKPTKEAPPPDSKLVFWREKSYEPITWEPESPAVDPASKSDSGE